MKQTIKWHAQPLHVSITAIITSAISVDPDPRI